MNRSLSLGIAIASVVASAMSAQAADLPPPGEGYPRQGGVVKYE